MKSMVVFGTEDEGSMFLWINRTHTTWRHNPEDHHNHHKNLKFQF
jgi:hypothetical protein